MTNNFKILGDFDMGQTIEDLIETIEEKIFAKQFGYIYLDGRKVLETLLSDDEDEILNVQIKNFVDRNIVPSNVRNSLYYIKEKGNIDAHGEKRNEKQFSIEKDLVASIEFLKNVFSVVKFFVSKKYKEEWKNVSNNEYEFKSGIYLDQHIGKVREIDSVKVDAIDMSTQMKGIYQLITGDFNFMIPTYQREYSWKQENVEALLSDIWDRKNDKKRHYFGALAISVDEEHKMIRLIDGQQRITTSLIFIRAVIDIYGKRNKVLPEEIEKIKGNLTSKYLNKVNGTNNSLDFVQRILVWGGKINEKNEAFAKSCAKINYDLIYKYMDSMEDTSVIDEYLTTFIHHFVVTELKFNNDIDNEIQIFENLNSKGLELSQFDLIKNYIFKMVDSKLLIASEDKVNQLINSMFVTPSSNAFGNRAHIKHLSNFFEFYNRIQYKIKEDRVLTDKGKVHKIFSKIWPGTSNKFETIQSLEESLEDAAKMFAIYCEIKSRSYSNPISPLFDFRVHLENLSVKDTHVPLLIFLMFKNIEWDGIKIKRVLDAPFLKRFIGEIDKYISRLIIVANKGQSLSSVFDQAINRNSQDSFNLFVAKIKTPGTQMSIPTYEEFIWQLENKNDWQKDYALSVIRTLEYKNQNFESGRYMIHKNPSLEHIFPQTVRKGSAWWPENEGADSFNRLKDSHINMLGNYIVLSFSLNAKAKNSPYITKLTSYKKDPDNLLIKGSNDKLMSLLSKEEFTFSDIKQRTKQLANMIAPLYKMEFEK